MNVLLCLHTSSIRDNSIDTRHHVTNCTLSVIHTVVKQPAVLTYSEVTPCSSICQLNEATICWPDWETPTGILLLFWHWFHYLYSFHKSLRKFANPHSVFVFVDCVFPSCLFQLPLQRHHSFLYVLASTNDSSLKTYFTLPPQAPFLCASFQDPRLIEEKKL